MNRENLHPLLRRALLFLENNEIAKADDYCEKYLDMDPDSAYAYVVKLMIRIGVTQEEDLSKAEKSFRDWNSYQNACRFAAPELRERLEGYLLTVEENIRQKDEERIAQEQEAALVKQYLTAVDDQSVNNITRLENAINIFEKIQHYKDSAIRLEQCREKLAKLLEKRNKQYEEAHRKTTSTKIKTIVFLSILAVVVCGGIICLINAVTASNKARISSIEENLPGSYYASSFDGEPYNNGGAMTILTTVTESDITYTFYKGNAGTIKKTVRYDEEPFLTKNGVRQWDSVRNYTESFTWDNLTITLFGKITVDVNGQKCKVTVNDNDIPQTIEIDGIVYNCN